MQNIDMNSPANYEQSLKEKLQNNVYLTEQQQEEVNRQREKNCKQGETLAMGDLNQSNRDEMAKHSESKTCDQFFDSVSKQEEINIDKMQMTTDQGPEDPMNFNTKRDYDVVEERDMKLKRKDLANDIVCAQMQGVSDARFEKERNKEIVDVQDYMDKRDKDEANEQTRVWQGNQDMKIALDEQIEDKKRGKILEKERDAAMQVVSNKMHQDGQDREIERERLVREKNRQYSEDLRKQIEENRVRKANDKKNERDEQAGSTTWDYMRKWDSKEHKYGKD